MNTSAFAMQETLEKVRSHFLVDCPSPMRVVTKVWRYILLSKMETFMFKGYGYVLKAKNLGAGVYEIIRMPAD